MNIIIGLVDIIIMVLFKKRHLCKMSSNNAYYLIPQHFR